eukprot:TRINITY_DN1042_c0_g2_i1.p1 TRINITY_DN1042_c0_g2~~TRINITY_DN1042_c0_g2_i1.p1  ORF type:complete len:131 (+),score=25.89 TRINITY_DN1042_c0_g2_i1:52-393(+)
MIVSADEPAVAELTDATFEDYIKGKSRALVMFYAPWCGHCKRLKPDYEKAAQESPEINLARVDCTEHRDLCSKYEVRGYPTLKLFKGDTAAESTEKYAGARTVEAITSFAKGE